MIKFENLYKQYVLKNGAVNALNGINLELPECGMIFVLGKSGCGKSTLLNILGGIDTATSGDIIVDGISIAKSLGKELDNYRREKVGFVFQEYNLIDEYSVYGNLSIALELLGEREVRGRVDIALGKVELANYGTRKTSELSGGQKQRVAIARAIVKNPAIILADEPTGNLDSKTSQGIMELLRSIANEKLVVVVSHDAASATMYGDRIIELIDGEIGSDNVNQPHNLEASEGAECNFFISVEDINVIKDDTEVSNTIENNCCQQENKSEKASLVIPLAVVEGSQNNGQPLVAIEGSQSIKNDISKHEKGQNKLSKVKKMSIGKLTKLSFINIWKKKFRLIVTMVLFVFSLTLFGIGVSGWAFDIDKVTYNTYMEQGVKELNFVKESKEADSLGIITEPVEEMDKITSQFVNHTFDYTYGNLSGNDLSALSESEKMQPYFSYGVKLLDKNVLHKYGFAMVVGEMPKTNKEFCISKLIADKLMEFKLFPVANDYNKFLNKVFEFSRFGEMRLVGILDTGDQSAIDNILNSDKFISHDARIVQEVAYTYSSNLLVNSDFIENKLYNMKTNVGTISYDKYGIFGMETVKTQSRLCGEKFAEEFRGSIYDTIVFASGVTSLGSNEIIVEKQIIEAVTKAYHGSTSITDEQVFAFLNTKPVLTDFEVGEGRNTKLIEATIVGYHEYADEFNSPIFAEKITIVDNNMVKREIGNINVLSIQTVLSGNSNDDIALIKGLRELGYEVSSYFSYDIIDAKHNTNVFKTLGMAIAGAFAIFSALMMFNFISASIKTNKKQIGVLRAIGMSTGRVSFIFLLESLILCLASFILSVVCVLPIANALTFFGSNYVVAIKNFIIDIPVVIAMLGFSIVVGILGSLVPIWRKARVSPVKLIRD